MIREHLVNDYFEGVHPKSTSLKNALDELKLEPIRGFSPEKRAEMIARTETRRIINTATLEDYKAKGVEFVEPALSVGACSECESHEGEQFPVSSEL